MRLALMQCFGVYNLIRYFNYEMLCFNNEINASNKQIDDQVNSSL
jgi:hypothetical protein